MSPRSRAARRLAPIVAATAILPGCATASGVSPSGEAVVFVDTDGAVPALVSRLRVDVYTADGSTWYASRDTSHASPADWPVSFALSLGDPQEPRQALVRLRAYAEGAVRDYRGESYVAKPPPGSTALTASNPLAPTDQPRLRDASNVDITPATEPEPLLSIDRLLLVEVAPGQRGAVDVVLRGACVGTMADVASLETCVGTEGTLEAVSALALAADMTAPTSVNGTFAPATPCTAPTRAGTVGADGSPRYDAEACVDGATFVFGTADGIAGPDSDLPQRIAILPPMRIDKYEVTVARWRAALAAGFVSPDASPKANEGPLPPTAANEDDPTICTWSATPRGREDYAITCATVTAARAFCQWLGGDLPTEAQWEYVASVAGRPSRTRYPWGGDDNALPKCPDVVFGRGSQSTIDDECIKSATFGPAPVDARGGAGQDVTPTLGLVNLGGNVTEWTRDVYAPLTSDCWMAAPLESPGCLVPDPPMQSTRGGTWRSNQFGIEPSLRGGEAPTSELPNVGFRCMRPGAP
jgi:formylglycine-generating enzyme required for sulfatase activity